MGSNFVDNTVRDLDNVFESVVVRGYALEKISTDTDFTINGVDLRQRYCSHVMGDRIGYDTDFESHVAAHRCDLRQLFAAKGSARKFLKLRLNSLTDENGINVDPYSVYVDVTWVDHLGQTKYDTQYRMYNKYLVVDLNSVPDSRKPSGFVLKANLRITAYDNNNNYTVKNYTNITL